MMLIEFLGVHECCVCHGTFKLCDVDMTIHAITEFVGLHDVGAEVGPVSAAERMAHDGHLCSFECYAVAEGES